MRRVKPSITQRHWTAESMEFLSRKLGHALDRRQQDWAFEVADPRHLNNYLALYTDPSLDADVRFTLADMIIQAFEDAGNLDADSRWTDFLAELSANIEIHAIQVQYWSAADVAAADGWQVSPWMRDVLGRIIIE